MLAPPARDFAAAGHGFGKTDQREHHGQPVPPGVPLPGREHTGGYTDGDREEQGRQRELERRRQPFEEQWERGAVVLQRLPEVPLHRERQPVHVLLGQRLVEPVVRAEALDVLLGDVERADHRLGELSVRKGEGGGLREEAGDGAVEVGESLPVGLGNGIG